jgi:hypothetical protein
MGRWKLFVSGGEGGNGWRRRLNKRKKGEKEMLNKK